MFHHTHAYIASKLYKSENDLLLVGSILPDIAVTKIIAWEGGLHGTESVQSFFKFIQNKYPQFLDLYKGILAHNILDDFTHKDYGATGYAYQNNKELVKLVSKYYALDDASARGKAHNYIESGVDILLLQENPSIQLKLKKALRSIDQRELAELLSEYFASDKNEVINAISFFFDLFTKYNFEKLDNWAEFWRDLAQLLSLKKIEEKERKSLLDMSVEVTKNTYEDFLNYALSQGVKKIV